MLHAIDMLTLRELEAATCLWLTWLLTLNGTGVASEESESLESLLVVSVDLDQSACYRHSQSLALTSETTSIEICLYVILAINIKCLQRLLNHILQYS